MKEIMGKIIIENSLLWRAITRVRRASAPKFFHLHWFLDVGKRFSGTNLCCTGKSNIYHSKIVLSNVELDRSVSCCLNLYNSYDIHSFHVGLTNCNFRNDSILFAKKTVSTTWGWGTMKHNSYILTYLYQKNQTKFCWDP